jgi:hypothetical protein
MGPRAPARLTDRDLRLLSFLAEHRLVLAAHTQAFLEASAAATQTRLRALATAGYVRQRAVFYGQPGCWQITGRGLAVIGSGYSRPVIDLRCYAHDVGVAWLWLAARQGAFGPMHEVIAERRLRSEDARAGSGHDPWGVRLGGYGANGRPRIHYPDVLLVGPGRQRIALELELSAKGSARLQRILAGYAVDRRIGAVVYLVQGAATARALNRAVERMGVQDLVHIQRFRWTGEPPGASSAAGGSRDLTPSRQAANR